MSLPKTTQERIKADAEAYATGIGDVYRKYATLYGYIAGATAEAKLAQKAITTIQIISELKSFTDKEGFVKKLCDEVLAEWKGAGKEVEG